ncbi:hypothetical protein MC7420_7868 [Coleofasciculus chthonoplastes PCC 7420]|uniref:Uncharacterized protein n=1 Tax=Coleofasciculus chthonoplastes PCC 7420 TaxID=118168 RepID=B4VJH6_9CYAN|nr:hypothetical protein MC7420_7868 [Coleofasciculus chthonoplastes PCC 7420]
MLVRFSAMPIYGSTFSPSSPNPNSGPWGEGEPDSLAPLSPAIKAKHP